MCIRDRADAGDLQVRTGDRIDGEQGGRVEGQCAAEFVQSLRAGGSGVAFAGEHADAGRCRELMVADHAGLREPTTTDVV